MYFNKILHLSVFSVYLFLAGCQGSRDEPVPAPAEVPASSRLSELLSDGGVSGYAMADAPRDFRFPRDHGPHEAYRNEWWYFTGNLDADDGGGRFGFELTIFRFALSPNAPENDGSAWATNQVYIGHFAVTDVNRKQFHVAQRYARGAAGLAGAGTDPLRVWLDDWRVGVSGSGTGFRLQAGDGEIGLDLILEPSKPIVLNGEGGLSQKSEGAGSASYYYSIPRLETTGLLRVVGSEYRVTGRSWLDREWGSNALSARQAGWDWFALQLEDGSDLMFYVLRELDGAPGPYSAGTWIDAGGDSMPLALADVAIEVTDRWQSEHGGVYPAGWRIRVPSLGLDVRVLPVLDNQELVTTVRYWEGAVDVIGERDGRPLGGRGYVELTGYDSD